MKFKVDYNECIRILSELKVNSSEFNGTFVAVRSSKGKTISIVPWAL